MRAALLLLVAALLSGRSAVAAVLSVPGDCRSIQQALIRAFPGDTVLLAAGVYTGQENKNLDFLGKDIVLMSETGPTNTVIDCEGAGRGIWLHSGETVATIIQGITIRNAYVSLMIGAGIYASGASPSLIDLHIENCEASHGAGIAITFSPGNARMESCVVSDNSLASAGQGGGVYLYDSNVEITDCEFRGNTGGDGGGISAQGGVVTIENTSFIGNTAHWDGAGAHLVPVPNGSADVTITNSQFLANTAENGRGGGMYIGGILVQVVGTTILGNFAHQSGGGVRFEACLNGSFTNCLVAENGTYWAGAGGVSCAYSTVSLTGITIAGNYAGSEDGTGGLVSAHFSAINAQNSLIALNTQGGIWTEDPATVTLVCSDVFGNAGGDWTGDSLDQTGVNGNISADPRFCGPLNPVAPYGLQEDSPCLPDSNSCGVLMGALPLGCVITGIPMIPQDESWGKIKSLY